ncbi:MAG: DUF1835 domain-containing protein [Cohaesibacter sp.]|jgi:hypothetical protein|nr:DUF1835 domain-containing protein [Cohaesibacter sp.]
MNRLIITNGDSAAEQLREAGLGDLVLPWRDSLHEGPVPDVTDDKFINARAKYHAIGNDDSAASIKKDFVARDKVLADHAAYDRIELWFEHDLYDQLQILEILDRLAKAGRVHSVFLVQAPTYLATQGADKIGRFADLGLPVLDRMFAFASKAWAAYRSSTPEAIKALREEAIPGFPFMGHALRRALQELPGPDGLSRTERQILYSLDRGAARPGMLFAQVLNMEEAAFLGDWSFFKILNNLQFCPRPAFTGLPQQFQPKIFSIDEQRKEFITAPLHLTDFGKQLLAGKANFIEENGIKRWWGGCELTTANYWQWDDEDALLSHHQAA